MRRGALAALLVTLAAACTPDGPEASPETPSASAPRLVSLAPHLTELTYTAGAGDRLVGVVAWSDFPPAALDLPRIGDAFRVDLEALTRLAPDVVLAWEGGNPEAMLQELEALGIRVERLPTGSLENIAANLRRIGGLTGRRGVADAAADEYLAELADLRTRHADAAPVRVFFQIASQPLYTVNDRHAIGQVVRLCGGVNVFGDMPELAPGVAVEAVVAADPEVLLTTGDADALARWEAFATLSAVANGHRYGVTADVIARDSTRILRGAREVCAHLERARQGG